MKKLLVLVIFLAFAASAADVWIWTPTEDYDELKQALIDKSSLKDPFSVHLRDVYVRQVESTGSTFWCGQINAKNSWGAYGGFQVFVMRRSDGKSSDITMLDDEEDVMGRLSIDLLCRGTPYSTEKN